MKSRMIGVLVSSLLGVLAGGCGDDTSGIGGAGGEAPIGGEGGQSTTGGAPSTGGMGGGESVGGAGGGELTGGMGGGGGEGGAPDTCLAAREEALAPIDQISTGAVTLLEEEGDTATLFVDASAGGVAMQAQNPWIYLDLGARARVDVTDVSMDTSTEWDLAIKRPILRNNSADGGYAGLGGAVFLDEAFEDVDEAAAAAATFETETWFDDACTLSTDPTGAIATSFDGWYLYEDMTVTPAPGTWLVKSGDGANIYKVAIDAYYANPDGSAGMAGGRYVLRVAEITP